MCFKHFDFSNNFNKFPPENIRTSHVYIDHVFVSFLLRTKQKELERNCSQKKFDELDRGKCVK